MLGEWQPIEKLRETSLDISGGYYSSWYSFRHNLKEKYRTMIGNMVRVSEPVEVSVDQNGNILCLFNGIDDNDYGLDKEFMTSSGKFVSYNHGEFGGELITPKGNTIRGNFVEVFEYNGSIYAIDSNAHLTSAHVYIYRLSSDMEETLIYPSDKYPDYTIKNGFSAFTFKSFSVNSNNAYVLISGYIVERSEFGEYFTTDYYDKSYLYKIMGSELIKKAEFDINFKYVHNMIIDNDRMILGMDKVSAIVDIKTKDIKVYTPIDIKAEKNLLKTYKKNKREGWV